MTTIQKRRIFWFEDDPKSLEDYLDELSKKYEFSVGAQWGAIIQERKAPFDLVLVDLMVHHKSSGYKSGEVETNIKYPNIHWTQTGVEFLRRIREGLHEAHGFKKDVPAIVATAVVDYPARDRTEELKINDFLEKPFTIEELEKSINKVFNFSVAQE